MRMTQYLPPEHPLSKVYRAGSAGFGGGLIAFGVLGMANQLPFFTTHGTQVLGLSSNGLLALISIIVGSLLVVAAVLGGAIASTTTTVIGALFLLSGLVNLAVIGTPLNLLAFKIQNVCFSLVAGMLLMFLGLYGRVSGGLGPNNPYVRYRHHESPPELPTQRQGEQRQGEQRQGEQRAISQDSNSQETVSQDNSHGDKHGDPFIEAEIAFSEGHPTPAQERLFRAEAWRHAQAERQRAYAHYKQNHPSHHGETAD